MDVWNREELYKEIWEQPLIKVAPKYGVSAVALGKTCRKLQIPLPGRGYWVKKDFGKPVEQIPLPEAKNLPVVHRMEQSAPDRGEAYRLAFQENLDDPELVRISTIEADNLLVNVDTKPHKLISTTRKTMKQARTDERGILQSLRDVSCLDIRVSKASLDRALSLMNTVILKLESEGFNIKTGPQGTEVEICGQHVQFLLAEKARVKARREIKEYSWTRTICDYEPTGDMEFRVLGYNHGFRKTWSDGKTRKLETLLSRCVGALMREGRYLRIQADIFRKKEIEQQKKQEELDRLAELIREEEEKVKDLDRWVTNWVRAEQMRGFVAALEKSWTEQGHDLSPEAPKGQRIIWMRQQAERVDPTLPNPPSILDRKRELHNW